MFSLTKFKDMTVTQHQTHHYSPKKLRGIPPFSYVAILFLLIILPLLMYIASKSTYLSSKASESPSLPVEEGVKTSSVSVLNDSSAIGGKYVVLSNPTNVSTFQPSAPYHSTFFYLWYKNAATDGNWSYWTDQGKTPPKTWFSHYLPDPRPGVFDPANELYSANSYETFKWQVSKLAEAKQEVAIASWWGIGTKEDSAFSTIISNFMSRADNPYPNLRWAVYYEDEGFEDPSVSTLVADLNHIKARFASSPYFLKSNNKPVVFVYAGSNDVPGSMLQRWSSANAQLGNHFYIVLKVFPGFETSSYQPDSWHQYAPAVRGGVHAPYSAFVSPGFWLDDGSPERLVRNPSSFESAVKTMVNSNVTWKLTETWNEWGEGTSVEPGVHVRTNQTTGADELNTTGYPFENLYIDILKNNLPSLEQGTGSQLTQVPSVTSSPQTTPTPVLSPTPSSILTNQTIVAVGDMVCGQASTGAACKQMETSDLALSLNPSAVLVLGDVQYEQGALSDFQNFYEPSWGRLKNVTYPVVGNHEYLTANAQGYFDYFNGVGNSTGKAGDRTKGYYAFNQGAWRIYVLNSNCSKVGGCHAGSPQETWLRSDLATNPKQCVLAAYHHPLRSSGGRETPAVAPLFKALYDFGVEAVLAGHEHNYERFLPQDVNGVQDSSKGVVEFIVGTGGRNFTNFVTNTPNLSTHNANTFGVLKMVLKSSAMDFEFVPIAGSNSGYSDKGTITCH